MSDSDHQKSDKQVRNNASGVGHPDAKGDNDTEGKQAGLDADADTDTDTDTKPSPLKNPLVKWGLIAAAMIAVIAGILWYLHYQSTGKFMQTTDDAYIQADTVTVSSKVAGYVEQVFVTDNQQIKAGTPLLRLDSREYRAQAAQAGSQIDVSRANAEGVEAQISEQRATIARARADLAAGISAGVFADAEVARYEPLAATGAETHEKLSQMRDQARQAHAQAVSARAAMIGAERHIATLQAQARQARAQGKGAEAQLAAVTVNVDSTLIRASIDGRIGDKTVRVGQYIQPATRMMSIVPVQQLYVEANFKETQLGLLRPGQPVTVEVDALSGVEIHGRVQSVSPGTGAQFSLLPPQNATGNFTKIVQRVPVRIAIDAGPETHKLLLPGMSVHVTVDTRSEKGAKDRIQDEQDKYNERRRK